MSTVEDLQNLTVKLAEHFQLNSGILSERLTHLFHLGTNTEICRLELFDFKENDIETTRIGMSFQIEVLSTDAVVMYGRARDIFPETYLLSGYYQAKDGNLYKGLKAYAMSENDKENEIEKRVLQQVKIQQIEEWEIQKLERSGKLRIH